jgi:hypothetical protein
MISNSKRFENIIQETKESIVRIINTEIDPLLLPELDYVELPERIRITSNMGEELDDYIIAVRKDQAILNTMFDESTPPLTRFDVEVLIKILKQIEKYKKDEY